MAIEVQESTYEETEFPEIVYKYRCWDENHSYHKRILLNQEVYFSSPKDFEDPLDCKNLVRWDLLTNEQIYDRYLQDSYTNNPQRTENQHRNFAQDWFNKSVLRNKDHVKKYMQDQFDELCGRLGILSLTEYNNSVFMWQKYSCNHTGICVGFNARETFKYLHGGGKVSYHESLPTIYPRPIHSFAEQINLQVYTKESKWDFEQEYRTIKLARPGTKATIEDRLVAVPHTAIREVIIGANADDATIQEVTEIVNTHLPHAIIKRALLLNDSVEIQ